MLASSLRLEISNLLPEAKEWLNTPHDLLGGDTPEQRIAAGDLESVRHLLYSIVYIGIS